MGTKLTSLEFLNTQLLHEQRWDISGYEQMNVLNK